MYEIILYLFLSAFLVIAFLFTAIMFLTLTGDVIDECREFKEKFSKKSYDDNITGDPSKANVDLGLLITRR